MTFDDNEIRRLRQHINSISAYLQTKGSTGAPAHIAKEGTFCWNEVDNLLYVNNNGSTGWTQIATGGGYSNEDAQDAVGAMVDASLTYVDATPLLQRAALTGDVTAAAGGNATTIAADAVSYAKMQNVSAASRLIGRGSAAGAGDPEEITIGAALAMSGTTLNLAGSAQTYAESNVTTDRTYDANLTTLDEIADVLGSLIVDLRARGVVA